MKNKLLIVFAFVVMGCGDEVKLKKGDKFLLEYGSSTDTWTVIGNNTNGYYCRPTWCGDCLYFFDTDDLKNKTFKKL